MGDSLWGDEFIIQETPKVAKTIIKKIKEPKSPKVVTEKAVKSKGVPIEEKLRLITAEVLRILGGYKDETLVIKTKEELVDYIDKSITNGVIAVDTETNNSLDPVTCKLMGPCIYTPGLKNAYIPINHINRVTGERLEWQLTEQDIAEQFARLSNTKIIMHNGKFDYEVIKCTCGLPLQIYWDTMVAAKILDENEKRAGLKEQYIDKIDSNQEKYSIEHLFEGVEYAIVDPDIFALYSATDPYMTYKLYEWQKEKFARPGNDRLLSLFMNVEMPVVEVAAEMELVGVEIDTEYAKRLSTKYHKMEDEVNEKIAAELEKYASKIAEWRTTPEANEHPLSKKVNKNGEYTPQRSKNEQLKNPPEVTSPTQLAILLYDVLDVGVIDKKTPRGTGEDILNKIKLPLCSLILEKRGLEKLINTYIDKLPACVSEKDGRLHAHFNQLGAGTGRFSSSDPNLQNIPSHNKEIRMMFKAGEGKVFVGSDFSQQEPRLLSMYSQDPNMIGAYKQGKDLYATMGVGVYHNDYWDNMEHHEDGSANPEGKKRRGNMKTLLLGIMYGMGAPSIANDIGCSVEDAEKILDNFYKGFPNVKVWKDETEKNAKLNGYVEDFWGRRRRLPDIQLPKYTIKTKSDTNDFNPLLGALGKVSNSNTQLIKKYQDSLSKVRNRKDYEKIKNDALKEEVYITDNGAFIALAERQCVNARVQGGAASMSKLAMRKVYDNPELRELGFHIVLQIHDELIGECPEENAERVADVLTDVMRHAAEPTVTVPFKCDADISPCWYYNDFKDTLQSEYNKKIGKVGQESAYKEILAEHSEWTTEQINDFLDIN